MKATNKSETKTVNLDKVAELLLETIEPETLAEIIDEIEFNYSQLMIENSERYDTNKASQDVYWLRIIRNVLRGTTCEKTNKEKESE